MDFTIGRKGFLNYIKALAGSNVVKVVPASAGASDSQDSGIKKLKVVCGCHTSELTDEAWIGEKTPVTMAEIRVNANNTVAPNIGSGELADALMRVLPFTSKDENKPVLACVKFTAKDGKLTLVSADSFRLAVVTLNCDAGEGNALINRDDLAGVAGAVRKAKRVRIGFESVKGRLDGKQDLIIETELLRYSFMSVDGSFPAYEKLIPAEHKAVVHFDTGEVLKAIASLKVLADAKDYGVDISLNGGMLMSNTDGKGQVTVNADIEGDPLKFRLDGEYFADALKACGDIADLYLKDAKTAMLFTVDGFQLVVMPMFTGSTETAAPENKKTETAAPAETAAPENKKTGAPDVIKEAEKIVKEAGNKANKAHKAKPKHRKVKEPVTV